MSRNIRLTFLIHAVITLIFGLPLLIIPGRFLGAFGWAPVDPLISRVLGAALLGLSWSSWRGSRAADWDQVRILVEAEVVFSVLGAIGLLRHLWGFHYPLMVWLVFALLVVLVVAWSAVFLVEERARMPRLARRQAAQ